MPKEPCPVCKGNGYTIEKYDGVDQKTPCDTCEGTGEIIVPVVNKCTQLDYRCDTWLNYGFRACENCH